MRVGIDIRPLQGETQYRGIGKSLEFVLSAMAGQQSSNEFVFYADNGLALPPIIDLFPGARIIRTPTMRLGRKRFFRSFLPSYLPVRPDPKDADVFFQYDAALGVPRSVPGVVIFHDAIPLIFKGKEPKQHVAGLRKYKNALAGWLYWQKYLRVLKQYKNAAHIIAISEASKADLLRLVGGVNESAISVVPHGVGGFDGDPKASDGVRSLTEQPYLLYVGGIDLRKNIRGLLQTFYDLKVSHPELRLITVGKEFGLDSQLRDMGWYTVMDSNPEFAKDVIRPGFLSNQELAYLYQHAVAFVLASRYEGFGMPVLEAFQAGCPVVVYNNSSIPEVAGDAALLVPDGESLMPQVERLMSDQKLRRSLITKGQARAKDFTWERTARETLGVLLRVGKKIS